MIEAKQRTVCIVLFDDVEVLDFAGPFEVFGVTGGREDGSPFHVFTVAPTSALVTARNGLRVAPQFSFANCPWADILVVPGGFGARREMQNGEMISWIQRMAGRAEVVLSVCTGALLLGTAGLLNGMSATTHHRALALLRETAPCAMVRDDTRICDNGKIVTSAGISAGIDASLHIVARLLGDPQALETAAYMEYRWSTNSPRTTHAKVWL